MAIRDSAVRDRMSLAATRALRSVLGFGAAKLASNDRFMTAMYDLMNETNFSGLSEHEEMLNDRQRVAAYHAAVHRFVRPGDVVLDLGTGSGLLAFFASRAGASKVYAVEHSDFIDVARDIARHNDITNIEFVQANSREFTPPEQVDVVVHEQMGDELFNENMLENVLDLRDRVLRPGGRILPARFRLFIEPVTFHESMRVRRFHNTRLPDDIDLAGAETSVARFDSGRMEQLWARPGSVAATVGVPEPILDFDLHDLPDPESLQPDHAVHRSVAADAIVDGFCVWFEAVFDDETVLTTSPLAPVTSWGNRLFRLDQDVSSGDTITYDVDLGVLAEPSTWTVRAR